MQATSVQPGRFDSRVLKVGIATLAIGTLIYFASRSVGGGLAGVVLSTVFSWLVFDLALSVVRGIWHVRTRVEPRHAILGGCLTAMAACCGGGLLLFFGYQLILGLILGGIASLVTNRTQLPTLAQLAGLDVMPTTAGGPSISQFLPRPVAALLALICVLAGGVLAGLGTVRSVENVTAPLGL